MYEYVNHPEHYGGADNPFEPIKITNYYNLNFNLGNVQKLIIRAGKKPDNSAVQDLEKAIFYLNNEIIRIKGE